MFAVMIPEKVYSGLLLPVCFDVVSPFAKRHIFVFDSDDPILTDDAGKPLRRMTRGGFQQYRFVVLPALDYCEGFYLGRRNDDPTRPLRQQRRQRLLEGRRQRGPGLLERQREAASFESVLGIKKGLYCEIAHYQRLGKAQPKRSPQAGFGEGQRISRYPELQATLVVRGGLKALKSQQ